jgi:hypothetical protein
MYHGVLHGVYVDSRLVVILLLKLLVAGADKFTSSRIMSWYLGFEYTWEEMS